MKEIDKSELTDEVLQKIAAGGDDQQDIVTKCCGMPVELRWWSPSSMAFVCTGCGKLRPELVYKE